jgi:hypothetical protein
LIRQFILALCQKAMNGNSYEVYIGLGLFVASEIIGMSKARENSVLQLLLAAARRAFPYKRR